MDRAVIIACTAISILVAVAALAAALRHTWRYECHRHRTGRDRP
ncbi:hypothetical protein [Novosphingobium sp. UBA1939]|nr:hypothetical protein [Novosphingobium sp. UBA1939]